MNTPNQPPPIITRAAKLTLDISVATLWQQTRTPVEAVAAIADVIWRDTNVGKLVESLRAVVADAKAGRPIWQAAVIAAESALADYQDDAISPNTP